MLISSSGNENYTSNQNNNKKVEAFYSWNEKSRAYHWSNFLVKAICQQWWEPYYSTTNGFFSDA